MNNKICLILRSKSGSGKTLLANQLKSLITSDNTCVICTADDSYTDEKGNYNFKAEDLGKAHGHCKLKFIEALGANTNLIIIANTNCKYKDFEFYKLRAVEYGYTVHILVVENYGGFKDCHKVPPEIVQMQADNIRRSLTV